mmetsp:Transcript_5108/g.5735  ORF Transcript_5108/g.5735 Transcript_5108/m.5735 type:complete len:97 (+) Transcript_5108:880-1170(+)
MSFLSAEMYHKPSPENHERKSKKETGILESLDVAHPQTENDPPETRTHIINLSHVASHRNIQVINYHYEVVKVKFPTIETKVKYSRKTAGSQNSWL